MSSVRLIEPVVRICAIITNRVQARDWAIERLSGVWGPPRLVSDVIPFDPGGFYTATMGPDLGKTLVAFGEYQDPAGLADWKHETNQWETEYRSILAQDLSAVEPQPDRPINLDAGYLSQAKLVLATIKDRDHRIYLRRGIFAEVTLNYTAKAWRAHRWSYPSYRDPEVAQFASRCRIDLRSYLKETGQIRRAT